MNKKLLVLISFCLFIFSFTLLSQEESKEKKIWEDGRIGITLDKTEWGYPSEPIERLRDHKLKEGYDFFSIYLTIVQIKDKNLVIDLPHTEHKLPQSIHLVDEQGSAYRVLCYEFTRETTSLAEAMSPKLKQGTKGSIFFQLPEGISPTQLKFIYPYHGEPPKPKKKKLGQIDIDLTHIQ
ncbi:MAG: hypothetical protein JSW00_07420 [Thermoplasmata archaeon]|nr:MAG: hypothetical protein JSW00_07420 [Thermoplasmata archaeon]